MGKKSRRQRFTVDPLKYLESVLKKQSLHDVPRYFEALAEYSRREFGDFCFNFITSHFQFDIRKSCEMERILNSTPGGKKTADFISFDSINKIDLFGWEVVHKPCGCYSVTKKSGGTVDVPPDNDDLISMFLTRTCINEYIGPRLGFEDVPLALVQRQGECDNTFFCVRVPLFMRSKKCLDLVENAICDGMTVIRYQTLPSDYVFFDVVAALGIWHVQPGIVMSVNGEKTEFVFDMESKRLKMAFNIPRSVTERDIYAKIKAIKYGEALFGKMFGSLSSIEPSYYNTHIWEYKFVTRNSD